MELIQILIMVIRSEYTVTEYSKGQWLNSELSLEFYDGNIGELGVKPHLFILDDIKPGRDISTYP